MRRRGGLAALAAIAMLAVGGVGSGGEVAFAQDASLNRARDSFDKAQALFEQGKYAEAAAEFEAAFQARPFAQFLFNVGACHEKLRDYAKAAEYYKRYLEKEPGAPDRKKTEKRIQALEKAVTEIGSPGAPAAPEGGTTGGTATPETGTGGTASAGSGTPPAVAELEDPAPRGLLVIESEPQGAYIYLDSKKTAPLSKTPWNGTLQGEHLIMLEREGYKQVERRVTPDANKLIILYWGLAEEDYLGWINITSNVPRADIYIDNKAVGVYQKAPFQGNLPPGKHKIWVTAEGYDEVYREINIVAGQTHKIDARLKGSPVGYINVRGEGVEKVSIYMDGKLLCGRGPCRMPVPQGAHSITVQRPGFKPYTTDLDMQAKTEVTLRARLAPEPGRKDAVVAYVASAIFLGGGIWAGLKARSIENELSDEIAAGMPPPDEDDGRFQRGKIYSIAADAALGIGTISLGLAVYYTFRDKGADSTGTSDVRALTAGTPRRERRKMIAWEPQVAPGYAGLGLEVRW
jgi:tetratricopeptide (TPR) repeat protein